MTSPESRIDNAGVSEWLDEVGLWGTDLFWLDRCEPLDLPEKTLADWGFLDDY